MAKERHRKRTRKSSPKRQFPWLWVVMASALILFIGGLSLIWTSSDSSVVTLDVTPEVVGAPRLAVDQEVIDEGYIKLDNTIRTTFRLRNVGDQPLHILGEPAVELVEGCWPPQAVVGSTTLNPGQETTLTMDYMMHAGMDGPHRFDVHLRTNDPAEPEKLLIAKSDWGP